MPHKDPRARRAYMRQWVRDDKAKNPEKYRENGRKHAKLYRERHRHDLYQQRLETPRDRYCKLRARCKKHGFELHLTCEQYTEIITEFTTCHYCDRPLSKTGSALDRVNNEPFYAYDNVVTCCARCNRVFNNYFTYEQKLILAEAIKVCDKMTPTQNSSVEESLSGE